MKSETVPAETVQTGTAHFGQEHFMEEVAASKRLADDFEKNFQAHREAFRNSQPEPAAMVVDGKADFPDFVEKAVLNNRVVPKDEEDDEGLFNENALESQFTENTAQNP